MDAKLERDKAKAVRKGEVVEAEPEVLPVSEARAATRQQPKRQTRQQRQQGSPRPSTGGGSGAQKRPAGQRPAGQRPGGGPKPANKKGKK